MSCKILNNSNNIILDLVVKLKIEDFMSKPVITLENSNSLGEAIELMKKHNIGSIVIIDDSVAINIVTEKDIINQLDSNYHINPELKISELPFKKTLITVSEKDSYDDAINLLTKNYIHHLIVINELGTVIGILSTSDIMKAQLRYNKFHPYFPTNQLIH